MLYILSGDICKHLLSYGVDFRENLILYLVLIFICVCLCNYGVSLLLFILRPSIKAGLQTPPHVPFLVPILGSIPLGLLWNPREFVLSSRLFWSPHPVRISLLGQSIYLIQGTANIAATLKQRHLSSFTLHGYILRHLFNLPRVALRTYHADKSGGYLVPYANAQVEPRNRVEFLAKDCVHRLLLGPGLVPLTKRLQIDLANRVHYLPVGSDWVTWDNFLDLFLYDITSSALDSLCGRYLLQRHPEFLKDLWTLDDNLWKLLWRFPRFLAPASYTAQDRALTALKDWHTWAQENFDPASVDEHGDDPYWGTQFFRDRQKTFQAMDGFDADATASQDLAFLWGATNNVIATSFWTALEIFSDPELLTCIRKEGQSCLIRSALGNNNIPFKINIDKLTHQPLLQAVYAETLRLRVNGFFLWRLSHKDMDIHNYRIPMNHYVVSSPIPSHMDPAIWSVGQNAHYPVDEFRVGRWLKLRSSSQPINPNADSPSRSEPEPELEFTTELANNAGAWMPFGGGYHACPGRRFAKVMVMLSTVMLVMRYDVEILTDVRTLKMSMRNFGFGVPGPTERVQARIKRREMIFGQFGKG
ncbi:cytochrome P450 [Aspergillus coremiiformis]|uniref:Cytochrome P450 n=1 Tax=Aspergillus coremiiformis TaxID=138285 RepID=A0A5N6YXP2_9EURO|nr:cytochrome P450 [Aspergillus coremiiformis]